MSTSRRLSKALMVLQRLEDEMMAAQDRPTGFRAAIQLAKYCGIVTEIAQQVRHNEGAEAVEYTGALDRVSYAMKTVHRAMGIPLPGEPVQLSMFERSV